jgi:transposase
MGRSIGVDLHRDCFTTAILAANGRCYTREWKLGDLAKFVETLEHDDKVAVEMTTNVRLFHDAVWPHVERVDVVNTRQFKVVTESVKKTDKNDAVLLARFLSKDMLPTVHLKEKHVAQAASLTRSRDTLVKQRTTLKNQVNNAFAAIGVKLRREQMSSGKALSDVEREAARVMDAVSAVEVKVLLGQIRALNEGIGDLEKMIATEGAKLNGFAELTSIKGIGTVSATILLSVIGDVKRFANEGKLASYLGIVPRVSDSNETEHRGRITKRGSKLARTALVQCALIAKRFSPYLASYHERLKRKKGGGKANIALARKLLAIVYRTLRNGWVFDDFAAFRLKDGTIPVWSRDGARKYAASQRDLSLSAKTGKRKRAT